MLEAEGLFAEALLERLIVLDAYTLLHNAVPFRRRKAERAFRSVIIYERIVQECAPKIDKARIIFEGGPIRFSRATNRAN
jgi:hypothetical protein